MYDETIRNSISETGAKLTSKLSEQWNEMSDEDKQPWIIMSEKEQIELNKNPINIVNTPNVSIVTKKEPKKESKIVRDVEELKKQVSELMEWYNKVK